MTKKTVDQFVCQQCAAIHNKWSGKCMECGAWNSLVIETVIPTKNTQKIKDISGHDVLINSLNDQIKSIERIPTDIIEFDRVIGGGLVVGAAMLLGGDPGIGKSTLVLQILNKLALNAGTVLYISGEESFQQIKMRAVRLGINADINIVCLTSLKEVTAIINKIENLSFIVVDSIQTIHDEHIDSASGSVSQVKSCAFKLIDLAKKRGFTILFIGHVTKDGAIAGPKILEHMVDTVLYFEGDKGMDYRMIRALKNRFGPANELAIFEMSEHGLIDVTNPSKYFLPAHDNRSSGSCVFACMEGSRPLMLEIQALCVPSYLPSPRRAVIGWDSNRLAMLVAVLNARLNINILDKEIYLNIVGGIRVYEPAVDLAVMASLISASKNTVIKNDHIFFGEVGLSGEVRSVSQTETRLAEAYKLGFKYAVIPKGDKEFSCKIETIAVNHINDLLKIF